MDGTTDGFELAEDDLRLRGEGTLLGARQQGQSDLRLASLSDPGDRLLLTEARRVAEAIVKEDPLLEAHPALADEIKLFLSEDEGEYLFKSSTGPSTCTPAPVFHDGFGLHSRSTCAYPWPAEAAWPTVLPPEAPTTRGGPR